MKWRRFLVLAISLALLVGSYNYANAINLDEAYRTALRNNESVIISRARTTQADESVTIAKSRLYPNLSVSGNLIRQKELSQSFTPRTPPRVFQHEKNYRYEVELRHRLYHGGKTWYGWSLRSKQARAESYRHFRRRQEILFKVARRYYGVLLAKRKVEIARNGLSRSQNQLERARGRHQVGEVTQTSVLRAEVSVSRAKQNLRQAQNNLEVSYQRLGLALGYDTAPKSVEDVRFDQFSGKEFDFYYERAVNNRRDLRQARAKREAAERRVRWQSSDYLPSVDFVSQYSNSDKPQFSSETENWSVQLVGTYPLFSGWMETAQVDRAQAQLRAAKARYQRIRKQVRVEVKNIYLDITTQRKVIETANNEVQSARQNYQQITAEFEQGLASAVDVNDALQVLQRAESRLATARYNFQLDLIRLKLASGTFKSNLITGLSVPGPNHG